MSRMLPALLLLLLPSLLTLTLLPAASGMNPSWTPAWNAKVALQPYWSSPNATAGQIWGGATAGLSTAVMFFLSLWKGSSLFWLAYEPVHPGQPGAYFRRTIISLTVYIPAIYLGLVFGAAVWARVGLP